MNCYVSLSSENKTLSVSEDKWYGVGHQYGEQFSFLDIFYMEEIDGNTIALRSIGNNHYLNTTNMSFDSVEVGPNEHLFIEKNDDGIYISTGANPSYTQYLSFDYYERLSHSNKKALFTLQYLDEEMHELICQEGCCGDTHEHGPFQWNDETHKLEVEDACQLFIQKSDLVPNALRFESLLKNEYFEKALFQGLKDADYRLPWMGFIYDLHFYDPDKNKGFNYLNRRNARTMANGLFNEAERYKSSIEQAIVNKRQPEDLTYYRCGYHLGLALHYLTDLTQPMHAANFTNVLGRAYLERPIVWDKRHSTFEEYAESNRKKFLDLLKPDQVSPSDMYADDYLSSDYLVMEAAKGSKKIWSELLEPLVKNKSRDGWGWGNHGKILDPILEKCMPRGKLITAAFLLQWTRVRHPSKMIEYTYQVILERKPDPQESEPWAKKWKLNMGEYTQKAEIIELVRELVKSNEYEQRFVNSEDPESTVRNLFKHLLQRNANQSEVSYWANMIRNEGTYDNVAESLINSNEYKGHFGKWQPPMPLNMGAPVKADPALLSQYYTNAAAAAESRFSYL